MPSRNRTLAVVTVAGLHGIALYGLITGLGVEYVKDAVTVIKGYQEPADIPPPPPKPEVKPIEQAAKPDTAQRVQHDTVIDVAPNPLGRSERVNIIDLPIDPIPFDPPGPTASPSPDKPAIAPKGVRPRGDPGSWVSTDDYPTQSLVRGEQGTVRFELAVGTDGRVTDCRVTASSGSAQLDAATCRYVARRARFEPATDGTGARVSGTYASSIRWVIPRD